MKIKLLTASPVMKEILLKNLSEVNLTADVIDSNQSLYHQLQDAEILVNSSAKLDRSIIDAAANLKMIHQSGIGVDNIDVEYCTTKSIYVAKRARAFGMKIFAVTQPPFSRKGVDKTHYVDNICGPENLLQFLVDADYVSIHTPLGNETRNMIGEKELNFMKKSAYLINVARAPIVAREPLFAALKTRSIAGAAFDVFWNEPPMEEDDKFLQLDNFILSPHIAGWTSEAVEATARIISINIARMSRGEVPLTVVNSELIR